MLMASKEFSLDVPRIIKLRGLKTNIKIIPPNILTPKSLCLPVKSEPVYPPARSVEYWLTNWFSLDWWWVVSGDWRWRRQTRWESFIINVVVPPAPLSRWTDCSDERKCWSLYNIIIRPSHHIYRLQSQRPSRSLSGKRKSFPGF